MSSKTNISKVAKTSSALRKAKAHDLLTACDQPNSNDTNSDGGIVSVQVAGVMSKPLPSTAKSAETEAVSMSLMSPIRPGSPLLTCDSPLTNVTVTHEVREICEGIDSHISTKSLCSLDDAVKLANNAVQEAKLALETGGSRNYKKDVKSLVVDRLGFLYELILLFSESRTKLMDKIKTQKSVSAQDLESTTKIHTKSLERVVNDYNEISKTLNKNIITLRKESEVTRQIIEHELVKPMEDVVRNLKPLRELTKEIKTIKETASLKVATGNGTDISAIKKVELEVNRLTAIMSGIKCSLPASYAEIAKIKATTTQYASAHTFIVSSDDPRDTADDVLNRIQTSLNPRQQGIQIERCRKAKDGKVIIGCNEKESANKMTETLRSGSLKVEEARNRNPLVEIRDVLKINTDTQIMESLKTQNNDIIKGLENEILNAKFKFRRAARNPLECHVVLEVTPKLWKRMVETGRLYIGIQKRRVIDRSPLIQCSRCLCYGHTKRLCTEKDDTCSYCGGKHMAQECRARTNLESPKCSNCIRGGDLEARHRSFSEECPVRRKWDAIARSRVTYC